MHFSEMGRPEHSSQFPSEQQKDQKMCLCGDTRQVENINLPQGQAVLCRVLTVMAEEYNLNTEKMESCMKFK